MTSQDDRKGLVDLVSPTDQKMQEFLGKLSENLDIGTIQANTKPTNTGWIHTPQEEPEDYGIFCFYQEVDGVTGMEIIKKGLTFEQLLADLCDMGFERFGVLRYNRSFLYATNSDRTQVAKVDSVDYLIDRKPITESHMPTFLLAGTTPQNGLGIEGYRLKLEGLGYLCSYLSGFIDQKSIKDD